MANKSAIPYDKVIETLRRQSIKQPKELLQQLYTAYSESTPLQLIPFVPVKLVGIIEGFCTIQYQVIIDFDATYRKRFFTLIKSRDIKLDADLINSLNSKTISFGEYASLLISCNNLQDIVSSFSVLLDKDNFGAMFSDALKKDIAQIFEYRHVFCHEMVGTLNLTLQKARQWITSAINFIQIINDTVLSVLYPNSPWTQTDMNISVSNEIEIADKELMELLFKLKKVGENIPLFPDFNFMDVFKTYRLERAKCEYASFNDGSIYPLLIGQSMLETTTDLIDSLKRRYRMYLR